MRLFFRTGMWATITVARDNGVALPWEGMHKEGETKKAELGFEFCRFHGGRPRALPDV